MTNFDPRPPDPGRLHQKQQRKRGTSHLATLIVSGPTIFASL